MKKFFNINMILGLSFLFLFILLIILLQVDKGIIAESGKPVGLSHINNLTTYAYNKDASLFSNLMFYATFVIVLIAVIIGLYQLIKNKSLKKVDKEIVIFGIGIVVAIIFWLLFDKVVKINVRPLDENEGSFPSTHVFLTTFFILMGRYLLVKYNADKSIKIASIFLVVVYIGAMASLRVVAGKHYITDVIGGVLLGLAFYFIIYGIFNFLNNKEQNKTSKNETNPTM